MISRQSGTNHIAEEAALHDEVPGKRHNETLQARWLDPVWLEAKLDRGPGQGPPVHGPDGVVRVGQGV